ncbi:MAG: hypothetical protein L3J76_03195 [Candidatus Hydrothermae bacterium]|nr:hypothetical protein [Candidatus Hydrothermae bacterium]
MSIQEELIQALKEQLASMDLVEADFYETGEEARGGGESPHVAVLVRETELPPEQRFLELLDVIQNLPEPVEFVIYTPEEWKNLQEEGSEFVARVLKDGIPLHTSTG